MKRLAVLTTVFATVLVLALPFTSGPITGLARSLSAASVKDAASTRHLATGAKLSARLAASETTFSAARVADQVAADAAVQAAAAAAAAAQATQGAQAKATAQQVPEAHAAVKPLRPAAPASVSAAAPTCPSAVSGSAGSAPGISSPMGVSGTTSGDLASFASAFDAIRVQNCLQPIPMANFRYDSCMEARLFWMAQDPSADPGNTWGHKGVVSLTPEDNGQLYSTLVPDTGCDGNIAGGSGDTGASDASKFWTSPAHRAALYQPGYTGSVAGVCIYFAMTHNGIVGTTLGEGYGFARAAARWGTC